MGLLDKIPLTLGTNDSAEYDPHTWDDPDKPSVRERLTPSDPRRAAIAGAAITLIVGLALYLSRLFPTTPLVFATGAIALQFLMYYRGRKDAFETIRDLDWSILATGNTATVRYGDAESAATSEVYADEFNEDGYVFKPARSINVRGEKDYLEVRDVFGTRENIRAKMHRTGKTGDAPARDYLPAAWTSTVETETLGDVYVTFTSGIDTSPRSRDVDRVATFPDIVPREVVGDIATEYGVMTDVQMPALARKHEVQERRADELAQPVEEQIRKRLDIALDIIDSQNVSRDEAARRAAKADVGDDRPGSMPSDAVDDYDRDVSESIDDDLDR
jgi:hypothetical protein